MKCKDCKTEEATEFFSNTGQPITHGRCERCYQKAVMNGDLSGAGRIPMEYYNIRTISRAGTEEIGRPARNVRAVGYWPEIDESGNVEGE